MDGNFKTHVALLDDHVGGFLRGKAYLVFGDGGTGKSFLGLQYAFRGAENGESAVYIALERPADLIAQAQSLGLELQPALERGDLIFLEYDQDVTSRIMRYGWKPFLEQLGQVDHGRPIRRIVFDPIHPLFAGSTEEGRLRYDLRYLVETLAEWGWTALFLNDRGATQGHPSLYRVFSEICSGVFELQDEVENLESQKYLFVHKLRQPSDGMRKIPFRIVPRVGIIESEPAPSTGRKAGDLASEQKGSGGPGDGPRPGRRPKVLLADDDPFVRSLLKKGLWDEFEILMAADGIEALTLTLREKPDVVVLDVAFPKLSGFEVCKSLRACGYSRAILFISAIDDPNERVRGLALGANDFITKPFRIREVHEKIRNASRFCLTTTSASFDQTNLEELLQAAHNRALPAEEFRSELEAACRNVVRYGVPLGIVRFHWEGEKGSPERTEKFRSEIEKATRPEDLLTFLGPNEAAVALNTEGRTGTIAYLRKLRRLWTGGRGGTPIPSVPSCLTVSFGNVEPGADDPLTVEAALERAAWKPLDLFADPMFETGGQQLSEDAGSKQTGTDG